MANRLDLFVTPILTATAPASAVNATRLVDLISVKRDNDPGIQRSNVGGWHSDIDMMQWGGESARQLAGFAIEQVGAHMADIAAGGKRQFDWGVDMWANVNGPGSANQLHCHPGAFWSGVYYPDAADAGQGDAGGELLLEDPRYPMAYMNVPDLVLRYGDGQPMPSQYAIRPETGMLVLFPSWLRHSVRAYRGRGERVSIALNLTLVPAASGDSSAA